MCADSGGGVDEWTPGSTESGSNSSFLTFIAYCFSLLAYCFCFCNPLLIIFILLWFSTSQLVNKSISVAGVYFLFIVAEEL